MSIAKDLTDEHLAAIGEAALDAYTKARLDHPDKTGPEALIAAGTAAVLTTQAVREEQRRYAETPRLTVQPVLAEPDAETLAEIVTGGQRG